MFNSLLSLEYFPNTVCISLVAESRLEIMQVWGKPSFLNTSYILSGKATPKMVWRFSLDIQHIWPTGVIHSSANESLFVPRYPNRLNTCSVLLVLLTCKTEQFTNSNIFIDREAGEIIRLTVSVCPSACFLKIYRYQSKVCLCL